MAGLKFLLELPLVLRQRRLSSERPQMTRDQFVRETASTELGKLAAAQLWDKLSALKVHGAFTPHPSDSLLNVYGLAEEDLDVDIIMGILKKLSCAVPDQVTVDAIGAINTPADVVRFVEVSCSRSDSS
jgi:hypothetical protein